jgi:hypothetical protein
MCTDITGYRGTRYKERPDLTIDVISLFHSLDISDVE